MRQAITQLCLLALAGILVTLSACAGSAGPPPRADAGSDSSTPAGDDAATDSGATEPTDGGSLPIAGDAGAPPSVEDAGTRPPLNDAGPEQNPVHSDAGLADGSIDSGTSSPQDASVPPGDAGITLEPDSGAPIECPVGFADCDLDPANGCEANLMDPTTCGSCARQCEGTEACDWGACVPGCSGLYTPPRNALVETVDWRDESVCSESGWIDGNGPSFSCFGQVRCQGNSSTCSPGCYLADANSCYSGTQPCICQPMGCSSLPRNECEYAGCLWREDPVATIAIHPCAVDNGGCGDPGVVHCDPDPDTNVAICTPRQCAIDNGGCGAPSAYSCVDQAGGAPLCNYVGACPGGTIDISGDGSACAWKLTSIVAGTDTCGLRADGRPVCWGNSLPPRDLLTHARADTVEIALGSSHACALDRIGRIRCWGNSDYQEVRGPNREYHQSFVRVFAGMSETCGVREDGSGQCWGQNSGVVSTFWVDVREFAIDSSRTCALRKDGSIQCSGDANTSATWGPNNAGPGFTKVAAGANTTCAITEAGALQCWGLSQPPAAYEDVVDISMGPVHACLVHATGQIHCWGSGSYDTVSGPNGDARQDFTRVVAASRKTCGLRRSGAVICWGSDPRAVDGPNHSLDVSPNGRPLLGSPNNPCALDGSGNLSCWDGHTDSSVVKADTTGTHGCALHVDGTIGCWGRDVDGEASGADALSGPFDGLALSTSVSCGLRPDRSVTCWGRVGSALSQAMSHPGGDIAQLAIGVDHSCALLTDGNVRCWGPTDRAEVSEPNQYAGGDLVEVHVEAGSRRTCGLRASGSAVCWTSSFDVRKIPTGPSNKDLVHLALGYYATCGVRADGGATCWGTGNDADQLNNYAGHDLVDLTSGAFCGRRRNGDTLCFGNLVFDTGALRAVPAPGR